MLKTNVNGISIAYERHGEGQPLMLVHGYPLDHSIWQQILPLLQNDFDVLLPDLRGFGESQVVEKKLLMDDFAADLLGLLDALKINKAFIAGHSMGGYAALAFARTYPERISGLGLVASQASADTPETKAGRYKQAQAILANGVNETAEAMPVKLTANLKLQTWIKGLILRQKTQGLVGALGAMAERLDSTPYLSGFDFPFVVIHGLADGMIPVERARAIKAAVPHVQLTEIPNAGHMLMMEDPQKTAEALKGLKLP